MKDKVDTTLEQRGSQYGDVSEQAEVAEKIKKAMHYFQHHWDDLSPVEKQSLDMIALKISRIICGDHLHTADSWLDIAGYAKLPGLAKGD